MSDKNQQIEDDQNLAIQPDADVNAPVAVQIDGDKAEVIDAAKADAKEGGEPSKETDKAEDPGVAALKAQLAEERRRSQALEEEKRQARSEASEARVGQADSNYRLVLTALDKVKGEADAAEQRLIKAHESMDPREIAAAQRALMKAEAQIDRIEAVKTQIEANKADGRTTEGRVTERRQMPSDPVEAFAETLSPASARWVREHPEYVRDPALNNEMLAAHHRAIQASLVADTPEYFAFIEKRLGLGHTDAPSGGKQETERREAIPAAPVSRDMPSMNGKPSGPTIVRLSAEERAIARDLDMSDAEYAKYKLEVEQDRRAGKLN